MSNVIHQRGDGDSACEGILLGLHFWIDCRYRLPSNQLPFTIYHLPFIIYHCNSSFNLVSADKAAVISEHTSKSFLGAEVVCQSKTAFGFARPVKAIGRESTTQPGPSAPSAQQQITIRQLFSRSIECFLFFLLLSWPNWVLSSSHPPILSLHEAHTHSANVASAYSDFINLRGSSLRESVSFQTISNLCWVFLLLLPLFIRYFILFSCDFCMIGSNKRRENNARYNVQCAQQSVGLCSRARCHTV